MIQKLNTCIQNYETSYNGHNQSCKVYYIRTRLCTNTKLGKVIYSFVTCYIKMSIQSFKSTEIYWVLRNIRTCNEKAHHFYACTFRNVSPNSCCLLKNIILWFKLLFHVLIQIAFHTLYNESRRIHKFYRQNKWTNMRKTFFLGGRHQ